MSTKRSHDHTQAHPHTHSSISIPGVFHGLLGDLDDLPQAPLHILVIAAGHLIEEADGPGALSALGHLVLHEVEDLRPRVRDVRGQRAHGADISYFDRSYAHLGKAGGSGAGGRVG